MKFQAGVTDRAVRCPFFAAPCPLASNSLSSNNLFEIRTLDRMRDGTMDDIVPSEYVLIRFEGLDLLSLPCHQRDVDGKVMSCRHTSNNAADGA